MNALKIQQCNGVLFWFTLIATWQINYGQVRYSVPEEIPIGSFVGNIAEDLGLGAKDLLDNRMRVISEGMLQYFNLNSKNGHLYVSERIDRDELCQWKEKCILILEVLVDKLNLFTLEIEITDVNDNAPTFKQERLELKIIETTAVGTHFPLQEAQDIDAGNYSLQNYHLSNSKYFSLKQQRKPDRDRYPELVLERNLDREEKSVHFLTLTATDGGHPVNSGTLQICVVVLDANDNAPIFNQHLYKMNVLESVPIGSVLLAVNATDADEAANSEVFYSFLKIKEKVSQLIQINSINGEISTTGKLDYEEDASYEIEVQAKDNGGLSDRAKVIITLVDVNDNVPRITVTTFFNSVSEDSSVGTVVALLNVQDRDMGENGDVLCSIPTTLPFHLEKSFDNYYQLVTDKVLDREEMSNYSITITAVDKGNPPLSATAMLLVQILDVNDNAPVFSKAKYTSSLTENNSRGVSIDCMKANDPDSMENATITFSIIKGSISESFLSSHLSINSETGVVYALSSFDYEEVQEIKFLVKAQDGGSPPLSSNVSVTLFILDQNDNAPEILYPSPPTDGSTGIELAPRSSEPGYLLCDNGGVNFSGVPVSQFVGIDGVRAFLQSYCHEVSLTSGSRKSQIFFPVGSCTNTLTPHQAPDKPDPLIIIGDSLAIKEETFPLPPLSPLPSLPGEGNCPPFYFAKLRSFLFLYPPFDTVRKKLKASSTSVCSLNPKINCACLGLQSSCPNKETTQDEFCRRQHTATLRMSRGKMRQSPFAGDEQHCQDSRAPPRSFPTFPLRYRPLPAFALLLNCTIAQKCTCKEAEITIGPFKSPFKNPLKSLRNIVLKFGLCR
uniref:Cadherin domain-containing protein n=1 Tax=Salvator merianae TaxID=96440 RepID=A0A8D0E115_SALMN